MIESEGEAPAERALTPEPASAFALARVEAQSCVLNQGPPPPQRHDDSGKTWA